MTAASKLPWFRTYTEMPMDTKIRRLRKGDHKWLWVVVMCFAAQSPTPGRLLISDGQPVDIEDLVDVADLPAKVVRDGLARMEQLGLIAVDLDVDTYYLPAWDRRQFKSDNVTARTRKHRQSTP